MRGEIFSRGGPVAPDTFSIAYSGTTQAYTNNGSFPYPAFATTGSSITGEDLMQVLADPSNVFCAKCLDFILQINSDSASTADITSVSLSGYAGYRTDAGYDLESVGGGTECGPTPAASVPAAKPVKRGRKLTAAGALFQSRNGGSIRATIEPPWSIIQPAQDKSMGTHNSDSGSTAKGSDEHDDPYMKTANGRRRITFLPKGNTNP
jgi:hypothetical protein